ncbi:monofunctional biosynthetic peptidoglycan transglycosylase [Alcaligenaceae bacterium]|nr:monofunctional biosynthetic peptidoglycan transglycosylase [Alcaligenaceae bacterium]
MWILRLLKTGLLAGVALLLLYQAGLFILVIWYGFYNPSSTAVMQQTLRELRRDDPAAQLRHEWVSYDQISTNLKRAVVASEDSNFIGHSGVEWQDIMRAWEYNRKQAASGGSAMRGGSTITQQLAKNLFLSNSRSYVRKGQELIITYMIELTMSKERILELYLNFAQWGIDVFGAQAAARHYYKRDAASLGPSQSARLASMLPRPAFYDQQGDTRYLRSRTATIQQRMRLVEVP